MSRAARPNLRKPTYGSITQGTIFSCAHATRYEGCEVFGLTITARCDVAQRKYPILNYLPIVKLTDWLSRDGLDILIETEKNELSGQIRKILRQAKISETLPLSVPLQEIAKVNFPLGEGNKTQKDTAKKFHEIIQENDEFSSLGGKDKDYQYGWFCKNRKPKIEDIVRRLSKHTVLGHYFFETLSHEGDHHDGFVCLLREVNTIPRQVAEKLGSGLDRASYEDLCGEGGPSIGSLVIPRDDLAMPVAEIASPTMEDVLQVFSNLFGRIGVADPDEDLISGIVKACLGHDLGSLR